MVPMDAVRAVMGCDFMDYPERLELAEKLIWKETLRDRKSIFAEWEVAYEDGRLIDLTPQRGKP